MGNAQTIKKNTFTFMFFLVPAPPVVENGFHMQIELKLNLEILIYTPGEGGGNERTGN